MIGDIVNGVCQVIVVLLGVGSTFLSYRFGNLMFAVGRYPGMAVGVAVTCLGLVGLFGIL